MGDYSYVPAGLFYPSHGGAGIYVRYGRYPNKILVKEQSPNHIWLQCPDRELVIVSGNQYAASFYPSEGTFDEYVDINTFNDITSMDQNIEYWMCNYTQSIGKELKTHRTRLLGSQGKTKIISDSGGYQILSERYNYIDPLAVIKWYNDNVDIGLVLDIPTSIYRRGLYERLAEIQRENTNVLLQHKRPGLELMNIFHGATLEDKRIFRDICEVDEIDRLAVGGAYFNSIMNSIDSLSEVILTGKKYKQYHVLGVSNVLQAVLLMRLASKGIANLITSDSSTPLQEALTKGYYLHPTIAEPPRYVHIGDKTNVPSVEKTLPCNCPVCRTIKYSDILSISTGCIWIQIYYHNIYSTNQYMLSMNEIAKDLSTNEFKKLLKFQFRNRKNGVKKSLTTLDYIDVLADDGLAKARSKYRYFLSHVISKSSNLGVLFDPDGNTMREGSTSNEYSTETPDDNPNWLRLQSIMETYEDATGIHGKKVTKKEQRKGHQAMRSYANAIPGKKKPVIKKKSPLPRPAGDSTALRTTAMVKSVDKTKTFTVIT